MIPDEVAVEAKPKKEAKKKYEGPSCSVCNKPLTDPESIKAGIGPLCRAKGWTKEAVAAKMATLKKDTVPEGWIKLSEVANVCRSKGIAVARLVRAVGGDRGMEEPAHPMFQVIYVGRARYLDPRVISEEGLNILNDKYLGKTPPEKKPREKKATDGKKAAKAEKAEKVVTPAAEPENPW
jgi:hypothetical protein